MADAAHDCATQGAEPARSNHDDVRLRFIGYLQNTFIYPITYYHATRDSDIGRSYQAAYLLDGTIHNFLGLSEFFSSCFFCEGWRLFERLLWCKHRNTGRGMRMNR